jgi:hypothetical protein
LTGNNLGAFVKMAMKVQVPQNVDIFLVEQLSVLKEKLCTVEMVK